MLCLRTPKNLVSPELDITTLGFQAWYEARQGRAAYTALERIARIIWDDDLSWFRKFLDIDVRYGTRLARIEPVTDAAVPYLRLHLRVNDQLRTETTHKLVLANGVAGNGAPVLPPYLTPAVAAGWPPIPTMRSTSTRCVARPWPSSAQPLRPSMPLPWPWSQGRQPCICLRGVTMCQPGPWPSRVATLVCTTITRHCPTRCAGNRRCATVARARPPPVDAVKREMAFPNFHLHLNAPWSQATVRERQVQAAVNGKAFSFDFVIAGTGYSSDPAGLTRVPGPGLPRAEKSWVVVVAPDLQPLPYVVVGANIAGAYRAVRTFSISA
jgi:hypothetical protein